MLARLLLDRLQAAGLILGKQRAGASLDPQRPLGGRHPGAFGQPHQRGPDQRHLTGPGRRLGQLRDGECSEPTTWCASTRRAASRASP
jgi:hypothetical protein